MIDCSHDIAGGDDESNAYVNGKSFRPFYWTYLVVVKIVLVNFPVPVHQSHKIHFSIPLENLILPVSGYFYLNHNSVSYIHW